MITDRKKCPLRHENGNCLPIGGFCTANNDAICEGLHNAYCMGLMDSAQRSSGITKFEGWNNLLPNPFINDPFSLVWTSFKNLYPDKEFDAYFDQHQKDQHDNEYGFTHFPEDGSKPSVFIYAEHSVNIQVETFAHELAHVAVGPEHEHDDVWEAAFDAIFKEYNRIGDEMVSKLGCDKEV